VVLFLLTSALPAFCEGFAPGGFAPRGEEHEALFSPAVGLFAIGPLRSAIAVDADASAPTASRTWRESVRPRASEPRGLARFTQRLVDPRVVGSALLATYATGRLSGLPNFASASARVAGATFSAAVLGEGLQLAMRRNRPAAPGAFGELGSFGQLDAWLPAEHTVIAFAAAAAIDEESSARWVPWVVYPVATAVGWAGASDHHRLSDVTAGAALGFWAGRRVDQIERGQRQFFDRARFLATGSLRNFRVGFKTRF
jgi:hypothetical protein